MTERIYSDDAMESVRRACYEAGRRGDEAYSVRGADGGEVVRCRDCANYDSREWLGCSFLGAWDMHTEEFTSCDMGPDGYCAWGRKR